MELQLHIGDTIATGGGDRFDALDAGDAVLDNLGDARFHHRRGSTDVLGANRNDGRVDIGVLAQGQAIESHQTEGYQEQIDNSGKDRPLDRNIRQPHQRSPMRSGATLGLSALATSTTMPSRTRLTPSRMIH